MRTKQVMRLLVWLCLLAVLLGPYSCHKIIAPRTQESLVMVLKRPLRVCIDMDAAPGAARLSVDGPCEIRQLPGRRVLARLSRLKEQAINVRGAIRVGRLGSWPAEGIVIIPLDDVPVIYRSRAYRGELQLLRKPGNRLIVINALPIDDYLAGVLGKEMPLSWPLEALKAQAIVSRTYALYKQRLGSGKDFDLVASGLDQVYGGQCSETARSRDVVRSTAGLVLTYGWEIFPTYYHSTCGGRTANVLTALGLPPIAPLSGVSCGFCRESRYYRWTLEIGKQEIMDALTAAGYLPGEVKRVRILARNKDERVKLVEIVHGRGKFTIPGSDLRRIIGYNRMRSLWLDVGNMAGNRIRFNGRGWGHGVGLCQWGARGMALAGYSAEAILRHYYPGSALMKLYVESGALLKGQRPRPVSRR